MAVCANPGVKLCAAEETEREDELLHVISPLCYKMRMRRGKAVARSYGFSMEGLFLINGQPFCVVNFRQLFWRRWWWWQALALLLARIIAIIGSLMAVHLARE